MSCVSEGFQGAVVRVTEILGEASKPNDLPRLYFHVLRFWKVADLVDWNCTGSASAGFGRLWCLLLLEVSWPGLICESKPHFILLQPFRKSLNQGFAEMSLEH